MTYAAAAAMLASFTYYAELGSQASQHSQDAADPVASQQELLICLFKNFFVFKFKLYELLVYFEDKSLVYDIVCKYFLTVCGLSFCFVYALLCCIKAFKFN